MSAFDDPDFLAKIGYPRCAEPWFAQQVTGQPVIVQPGSYLVPPVLAADLGDVVKLSAYIEVPNELLDGTPRQPVKVTRRQRLRRRWSDWRERTAHRAFKLIAGYDVPDGDDW